MSAILYHATYKVGDSTTNNTMGTTAPTESTTTDSTTDSTMGITALTESTTTDSTTESTTDSIMGTTALTEHTTMDQLPTDIGITASSSFLQITMNMAQNDVSIIILIGNIIMSNIAI